MLKSALLWILDPDDKCSKIYKDLKLNSVFNNESCRYKKDLVDLCHDLLQDPQASGLNNRDVRHLLLICEKCTTATEWLTVRERTLPYVLATRCFDRQQQNGVNLQWIIENRQPDIQPISHQDETIYSRKFYNNPGPERIWVEYNNDNKYVGLLSHYKIAYPNISKETARKCRVWALRILRMLPHLLLYDGRTADREKVTGVRNYYLPDQEIHAKDKELAVAVCRVLEDVLK